MRGLIASIIVASVILLVVLVANISPPEINTSPVPSPISTDTTGEFCLTHRRACTPLPYGFEREFFLRKSHEKHNNARKMYFHLLLCLAETWRFNRLLQLYNSPLTENIMM
jgi:hypothetical protein